jgi:hypothetical protein
LITATANLRVELIDQIDHCDCQEPTGRSRLIGATATASLRAESSAAGQRAPGKRPYLRRGQSAGTYYRGQRAFFAGSSRSIRPRLACEPQGRRSLEGAKQVFIRQYTRSLCGRPLHSRLRVACVLPACCLRMAIDAWTRKTRERHLKINSAKISQGRRASRTWLTGRGHNADDVAAKAPARNNYNNQPNKLPKPPKKPPFVRGSGRPRSGDVARAYVKRGVVCSKCAVVGLECLYITSGFPRRGPTGFPTVAAHEGWANAYIRHVN